MEAAAVIPSDDDEEEEANDATDAVTGTMEEGVCEETTTPTTAWSDGNGKVKA